MDADESRRADDTYAEARSRLTSTNWTVILGTKEGARFSLVFQHSLTLPMSVSSDGNLDPIHRLNYWLDWPEFSVVSKAPRDAPHAMVMRQLRELATMDDWSPEVLPGIAGVLGRNGVLTESEAVWLASAGKCWVHPEVS